MSNSKKQKDQSDLVNEKVEVSPVSESDAAASKEEDPFHTAVESITSSPVTSEKKPKSTSPIKPSQLPMSMRCRL